MFLSMEFPLYMAVRNLVNRLINTINPKQNVPELFDNTLKWGTSQVPKPRAKLESDNVVSNSYSEINAFETTTPKQ